MGDTCRCSPVPARAGDLVRTVAAFGLSFTESRHSGSLPLHAHAPATLTILLAGGFEETYEGRRAPELCERFGVLLRRPGEAHADRFSDRGALNLVIEMPERRFQELESPHGTWGVQAGADLEQIARRLHAETRANDVARDMALEGLTLELLAGFVRAGARRGASDAVTRARRILDEEYRDRELRVATLAQRVDMHPVSFARAFRAKVGRSPSEYVRELRLAWGFRQLRVSRRSIASISEAAGFADQSHFTRAFRARYRTTPGRCRADS